MLVLGALLFAPQAWAQTSTPAAAAGGNAALVEQGRQLAVAADCAACHTAPGSTAQFSGGYAITSPLGEIFSTNITPSKTAGIGDYSLQDFTRALREGIRKDGAHLYPAMPYTAYTKLSDADVAALYAYFMHGVTAVDKPAPETALPFPFNLRFSMALWNALYLDDTRFKPDPSKSAEWNRGAYLADALAHCGTCHTPRGPLMAEKSSAYLAGGSLGSWYAPNITSDPVHGIGSWSQDDIVAYLKTGHVPGKAQAAGPMAEAVEHSLQFLPEADLKALATYLHQVPAQNSGGAATKPRDAYGAPSTNEVADRGLQSGVDPGWRIYSGTCANCHQANGQGNGEYPSLFHNTVTGADRPDNLISAIVFGVDRTVDGKAAFMPAFGPTASFTDRLSDTEIAAVSNYVFAHFGNPTVKVTAADVTRIRTGGTPPLLARLRPLMAPAMGAGAVLVVLIVVAVALRCRRRKSEV